jgi:2-polyprenyl-6-methoxyphenol hydroxylase-like FAD-dependent oxidoreductase
VPAVTLATKAGTTKEQPVSENAHHVLIVGGGIGGLTAAIALRQGGHTVELVEIREDWAVTGWGLSLTGPALRALDALGLAGTLIGLGYGITEIANCDSDGNVIAEVQLPSLLGPGRPAQAGIARSDLARVLRESAEAHGAVLRTSLTVSQTLENGGSVKAMLSDGSTRDADLVVVADGAGSKTRKLLGINAMPEYTGQMVWRAVVPRPAWADRLFTFFGPGDNAGLIPISQKYAYCFLTENTAIPDVVPEDELADKMRAHLAPFGGRVAEVRDSILAPEDVVRRAVNTVLAQLPWNAGRAVLLGDAAHTPSPQLVSGAALAIEDAVVLAEELARTPDTLAALHAFGERRFGRARLVVEASGQIAGLEQAGRQSEVPGVLSRTHGALAAPV